MGFELHDVNLCEVWNRIGRKSTMVKVFQAYKKKILSHIYIHILFFTSACLQQMITKYLLHLRVPLFCVLLVYMVSHVVVPKVLMIVAVIRILKEVFLSCVGFPQEPLVKNSACNTNCFDFLVI